jgi:hypothetical protein
MREDQLGRVLDMWGSLFASLDRVGQNQLCQSMIRVCNTHPRWQGKFNLMINDMS